MLDDVLIVQRDTQKKYEIAVKQLERIGILHGTGKNYRKTAADS